MKDNPKDVKKHTFSFKADDFEISARDEIIKRVESIWVQELGKVIWLNTSQFTRLLTIYQNDPNVKAMHTQFLEEISRQRSEYYQDQGKKNRRSA